MCTVDLLDLQPHAGRNRASSKTATFLFEPSSPAAERSKQLSKDQKEPSPLSSAWQGSPNVVPLVTLSPSFKSTLAPSPIQSGKPDIRSDYKLESARPIRPPHIERAPYSGQQLQPRAEHSQRRIHRHPLRYRRGRIISSNRSESFLVHQLRPAASLCSSHTYPGWEVRPSQMMKSRRFR